jgi:hypothetical protein
VTTTYSLKAVLGLVLLERVKVVVHEGESTGLKMDKQQGVNTNIVTTWIIQTTNKKIDTYDEHGKRINMKTQVG